MTDVVALLAALGVGGVLGGWLRGRHERAEAHRERMIAAAEDFLEKVAIAEGALGDAETAARHAIGVEEVPASTKAVLEEASRTTQHVDAVIPRMMVVFPNYGRRHVFQPALRTTSTLRVVHDL